MNPGQLRDICRIEYQVNTPEPVYGTPVVTWALLAERWCHVQDVLPSRSESVKQGLEVALNQTRLRMRYFTDIDSTMRIIINRPDPVTYQIISGPAVLGNKEGLEFIIERASTDD